MPGARGSSVSDGAGDFAQLAKHLGVEQAIIGALRLEDRDAKCGDALVQRPTLALDCRPNFERTGAER